MNWLVADGAEVVFTVSLLPIFGCVLVESNSVLSRADLLIAHTNFILV